VAHTRRRRILLVVGRLGAGGAELQLIALAVGLARQGHEVTVACLTEASVDLQHARDAGVRFRMLGAGRRTRPLVLGPLIAMARRAHVVQCNSFDASLWGRIAAAVARRPVVVTEHTPGREWDRASSGAGRGRWIARHNRVLDPVTYTTIAVARWQRGLLTSEGVAADKIVHVPNGVLVSELRAAAHSGVTRDDLGLPPQAHVLVHVARFQPQKNQAATLQAVRSLRETVGDVRAVFAGDGPERPAVERLARELGVEDAVLFLGRRPDVPALLALADVMVLPSLAEAMPMTIIESMAVGTPVVATDVGDVGDVISQTGGGLCVAAGDQEAFTAACLRVLTDDTLRRSLAERALAASDEYDSDLMARRYEAVFEAAIAGTPPRAIELPGAPRSGGLQPGAATR
jgi:glycosyltransferase involved in cell wall biosynthesis